MIAMAMRQSLAMAQEATAGAEQGGGSGGDAAAPAGGGSHGGLPADINVALLEANGVDLTQDVEMLRVMQVSLNEAFGLSDEPPAHPEGSPRASATASDEGSGAAGASVPSPGAAEAGTDAAGAGATGAHGDDEDGGFDEAAMMAMMEGLDASDPDIAASLQAILEAQQEQLDEAAESDEDDEDKDASAPGSDSSAKRPKPDGSA
jgi:hypothetical protein